MEIWHKHRPLHGGSHVQPDEARALIAWNGFAYERPDGLGAGGDVALVISDPVALSPTAVRVRYPRRVGDRCSWDLVGPPLLRRYPG